MKNIEYNELTNLKVAQQETKSIALEIANSIEVGMNEIDVYQIASQTFRDRGIKYHWHIPYIGLGYGTNKLRSLRHLGLSLFQMKKKISQNDIVLVDIAPMINNYPTDYTVSKVIGNNFEHEALIEFTKIIANKMVEMVDVRLTNKEIFLQTKKLVEENGKYKLGEVPIINLGHRILKLPRITNYIPEIRLPFLIFYPKPSFINGRWNKVLDNLWAIEPYVLSADRAAKYEELIFIDNMGLVHRLNPIE